MELKLLLKDQDRKSTVASSRRLLSLQEAHRDLRMLDKLHGPLTNTHPINIVFDLSNETAYDTILNQVSKLCFFYFLLKYQVFDVLHKVFEINKLFSQIRNVGMNKNGYSYLLGSLVS